jgi:regulation of enolase protein 1 (concanavalin A-like superfamily)
MLSLQPYTLDPLAAGLVPGPVREGGDATHLVLRAEAGDDLFFEPGAESRVGQLHPLGAWMTDEGFQFSARVRVDFLATFDSAVILGWFDEDRWFKICSELDPQGHPRVVSVVTRGRSDDSNGAFLTGEEVYLRVSRAGRLFSLHSSTDSTNWDLVRMFEMNAEPTEPIFIGIAVQSPSGDGTTGAFDEITFIDQELSNPRDGS